MGRVSNLRTWQFPEAAQPHAGPWQHEPDKAQWVDNLTDLDCLIVRGPQGALCGYVGVAPQHPWHGLDWMDDLPPIDVHGSVNFSSYCQDVAHDGWGVCHLPAPGRPEHVWWLGFDCGHFSDYVPKLEYTLSRHGLGRTLPDESFFPKSYKNFGYVTAEVHRLADQIHDAR